MLNRIALYGRCDRDNGRRLGYRDMVDLLAQLGVFLGELCIIALERVEPRDDIVKCCSSCRAAERDQTKGSTKPFPKEASSS